MYWSWKFERGKYKNRVAERIAKGDVEIFLKNIYPTQEIGKNQAFI